MLGNPPRPGHDEVVEAVQWLSSCSRERMRAKPFPAKVDTRITSYVTKNTMSYMQELEVRLEELPSGTPEKEIIIREIKKIALENYRNGQHARAPAPKPQDPTQPPKARHARNDKRSPANPIDCT